MFTKNPKDWLQIDFNRLSDANDDIQFIVGVEGLTGDEHRKLGYCGPIQIVQWCFGATKGHVILRHMLDLIMYKYFAEKKYFDHWSYSIHTTGPAIMTEGIDWYFKSLNKDINILWDINEDSLLIKDVFVGPLNFFNCGYINPKINSKCNGMTAIQHKYAGSWKHG